MSRDLCLIVFDVDGTLVDSQDHIYAAMRFAFDSVGQAVPPKPDVLGIVGLSLPVAMSQLAPKADRTSIGQLVSAYKNSFATQRKTRGETPGSPLYPGALESLTRLSQVPENLLGVATGKSRRGLDHVLASHGLAECFVTQQVADNHPSKPHPAMLEAALAETGVQAHRAVMIGDTEFDIEMGHAAGFRTIGVTWGYHSRDRLKAAGPDRIVDSFAALGDAISELWS